LPFDRFAARVTVMTGQAAAEIRARYIARFVDTTTAYYQQYIAHLAPHGDGMAYEGYVWDTLAGGRRISEADISEASLLDQDYLPADLYIFDLPMSWSIVFTHEWDDEHQRIYLRLP
jgi:hypothetical protein